MVKLEWLHWMAKHRSANKAWMVKATMGTKMMTMLFVAMITMLVATWAIVIRFFTLKNAFIILFHLKTSFLRLMSVYIMQEFIYWLLFKDIM